MDAEAYLQQRVENQMKWYSEKSTRAQSTYKRIRFAEIFCAALIPLVAGAAGGTTAGQIFVGVLGAIVVVLAASAGLGKFQENWVNYRGTCETLTREKFLFLARAEPYDAEPSYPIFVKRVETILGTEHANWAQNTLAQSKGGDAKKT
jgi:hypothetical protein